MAVDNVILFEDGLVAPFFPLLYSRAVFELKVGMMTSLERAHVFFPDAKYSLMTREAIKPLISQRYPKYFINNPNVGLKAFILNGRALLSADLIAAVQSQPDEQVVVVHDNEWVAGQLEGETLIQFMKVANETTFDPTAMFSFVRKRPEIRLVDAPSCCFKSLGEMIQKNGETISSDFNLMNKGGLIVGHLSRLVEVTNESQLHVGKRTHVGPFVHLDASKGPIYIGEDVTIKANVVIEGPVFIDDHVIIQPAFVRGNTSIGHHCRVGGEIEGTIMLPYSNKYHAGFVGHSYIGEWVNLGAMTTTSDLKNTYGTIQLQIGRSRIDTELQFLGSLIGDHVKMGIGTLLSTGSVIGFGAMLATGGFVPKWVPSFSWITTNKSERYDLGKFLETTTRVWSRRAKTLLPHDRAFLEMLYRQTEAELS
jgi:UDP-N-acetylglucosamine diphosphorylase/glucosamine-1-phosphate N-acetyltransferase